MTGQTTGGGQDNVSALVRATANQIFQSGIPTLVSYDTTSWDLAGTAVVRTSTPLTGTLAKTASSSAIIGTGTLFTTELVVGDWIDVPGTATERRQVASITDNTHLAVTTGAGFVNTASGQIAQKVSSGIKAVEAGIYEVIAQMNWDAGGTGFRQIMIEVNGVADESGSSPSPTPYSRIPASASNPSGTAASHMKLAAGDVVRAVARQTQGANVACGALGFLCLTKIAPG